MMNRCRGLIEGDHKVGSDGRCIVCRAQVAAPVGCGPMKFQSTAAQEVSWASQLQRVVDHGPLMAARADLIHAAQGPLVPYMGGAGGVGTVSDGRCMSAQPLVASVPNASYWLTPDGLAMIHTDDTMAKTESVSVEANRALQKYLNQYQNHGLIAPAPHAPGHAQETEPALVVWSYLQDPTSWDSIDIDPSRYLVSRERAAELGLSQSTLEDGVKAMLDYEGDEDAGEVAAVFLAMAAPLLEELSTLRARLSERDASALHAISRGRKAR